MANKSGYHLLLTDTSSHFSQHRVDDKPTYNLSVEKQAKQGRVNSENAT